ncbi:DUF3089 domain-containing protein [uncultured Methanocorpusculum sp.]|nr:DUF3089 domain-containing protein [uncultured Methanocorpusculum sp.]
MSENAGVDYSDPYNWLYLPQISKEVDVFYVYPTVSSHESGSMPIAEEGDRALARGFSATEASVYEPYGNVFTPYYRQMTSRVKMDDGDKLISDTKAFKQGARDIQDAFEYYLEHLSGGRPFILAGHSQGTMTLIELIKNRFRGDEELRSRLIAAYLIGYTVTDDDLSKAGLTGASGAYDTGVVITYNTQSPSAVGSFVLMEGAKCINPLNWKTDSTYAPATENLGARFYNVETGEFLREVIHYADAQIDLKTGALMATIPADEDLEPLPYFPKGVYHRYDYAFWYRNLQQNVGDRINTYLQKR